MKRPTKVVVDTNVIISAIIGNGEVFTAIYDAFVNGAFVPVISPRLLAEILDVVSKPRLRRYFRAREFNRFNEILKTDALFVDPRQTVSACRDPRDNFILEMALAAQAQMILTRDEDLLVLGSFESIPIVSPDKFLERLNS